MVSRAFPNRMNPIVERIKKLLRMKRGGTPAEVETALGLARKIAAEHGIDLDSIDPEEKRQSSEWRHESAYLARRVPFDARYAAKICERFFNVEVVFYEAMHGFGIYFVGRVFEIEIALYIFRFLRGHFSRCWRVRENRLLRSKRSFVYGMFVGICSKLKQQKVPEQSSAIALSRLSYMREQFPRLREVEHKAPEYSSKAMTAGFMEGLKTNLRKGVERPQTLQLGL